MKCRYSGKKSEKFWARINGLLSEDYGELYSLGVALQNLEGQVIKRLNEAQKEKKRKRQ